MLHQYVLNLSIEISIGRFCEYSLYKDRIDKLEKSSEELRIFLFDEMISRLLKKKLISTNRDLDSKTDIKTKFNKSHTQT